MKIVEHTPTYLHDETTHAINFAALHTSLQADPLKYQAFFSNPVPHLEQAKIPVLDNLEGVRVRHAQAITDNAQNCTFTPFWWGVDIWMSESFTQQLINGTINGGQLLTFLMEAITALKSLPGGDIVVTVLEAGIWAKTKEMSFFDKNYGIHWPISWAQWGTLFFALPLGPSAVAAALAVFFHPQANEPTPEWQWTNFGSPYGDVDITFSMGNFVDNGFGNISGIGTDNNLWTCWYDNIDLHWTNLGQPTPSITMAMGIFIDNNGFTNIAGYNGISLLCCFYNNQTWQWINLGYPSNNDTPITFKFSMGAITSWGKPAVFAMGSDNNLYACWNDGNAWSWINLNCPLDSNNNSINIILSMGTLLNANGIPSVFGMGSDGNLWTCWYNPSNNIGWNWSNLGKPAGNITITASMNTLLLQPNNQQAIFGLGSDGHMYGWIYNNAIWSCVSFGNVPGGTYSIPMNTFNINGVSSVFSVSPAGGILWEFSLDGTPQWISLGQPPANASSGTEVAIQKSMGTGMMSKNPTIAGIGSDNNIWGCWFGVVSSS